MKNNNTFFIIALIGLAFLAGYLWNKVQSLEEKNKTVAKTSIQPNAGAKENSPPTTDTSKLTKPSVKEDHWRGNQKARFVWIEYSDLECPFCQKIHPDLMALLEKNKTTLAWVYRHYPLGGHPKAQKSAEATECAAEQKGNDGFWKMTDLIFEKMPAMELADLPDLAQSMDLNKNAFIRCLDSGKYTPKVNEQRANGDGAGVLGTPSSFIYDLKTGKVKLVKGALPFSELQSELDAFVKQTE